MSKKIALRIVWSVLPLLPVSGANLLTNGSFETTAAGACTPGPPANYVDIGAGSGCLTDWTVTSGTIDILDNAGWQAENGNISLDMGGVDNGGIEQAFTTVPGAVYDVTFWLAGNANALPVVKTLQVSADGDVANYSFNTTGKSASNMGWVQEAFDFTATGTTATLEFLSTDNPNTDGGPALDNVTAVEAPEPGSIELALVGAGLLVLGHKLRARQSKKQRV